MLVTSQMAYEPTEKTHNLIDFAETFASPCNTVPHARKRAQLQALLESSPRALTLRTNHKATCRRIREEPKHRYLLDVMAFPFRNGLNLGKDQTSSRK